MSVVLRGWVSTCVGLIGRGGESGVFSAPQDGKRLGGDVTSEHRGLKTKEGIVRVARVEMAGKRMNGSSEKVGGLRVRGCDNRESERDDKRLGGDVTSEHRGLMTKKVGVVRVVRVERAGKRMNGRSEKVG